VDRVARGSSVLAAAAVTGVVDVAALPAVHVDTLEKEVERSGLRRPPAPNNVRKPPRTPLAEDELSDCCS